MKQGVTVVTHAEGIEPCTRLLKSLWTLPYPVLVVMNDYPNASLEWVRKVYYMTGEMGWQVSNLDYDGFEIGAIEQTLKVTDWDEFVVLQDTIEIKDQEVFEALFEVYKGRSVAYNPHFQMYLGKYRREALEKMELPKVRSKIEAVRQEEIFAKQYMSIEPTDVFNPQFKDEAFYDNWEEMFGRTNLKMEDEYIIKRKGTWTASQLI